MLEWLIRRAEGSRVVRILQIRPRFRREILFRRPRGRPDSSPIYGAASLSILLVVVLTYSLARRITIPLKKLRAGAGVIAAGDFTQRVEVSGRDEIGELARTFNEMAQSLEERSQALLELNRKLEERSGANFFQFSP